MKEPLLIIVKRLVLCGLLSIPLCMNTAYAQEIDITVSGIVTDSTDNLPLPGVNVVLKGTKTGTQTGADGHYVLTIPSDGTLVFSFLGYVSQEIQTAGRTTVDVLLQTDTKQLQEVVVIGYQTVNKRDLTGAVSVINPNDAQRVTATSVAESLQGLSPGITVRNSGVPGQNASIQIRGVSSFLNTDPLYVIDGMIADANITVNSNDVESIQVLKDASAAAIYGSRAANGVVIITTKHGKEGTSKVNFSAKYGIQQIPKRYDLMNSSQFAAMQRTQYENSGATPLASVAEATFDPSINTNWQDQVLQTGSLQDYNLSVSGGSRESSYLISGSYFMNDGYVTGRTFERTSLRINTQSKKGRVTFGENLLLSNSVTVAPETGNPIVDMATMLPVIPVQDDSYITSQNPQGWGIGTDDAVTYAYNPVAVRNLSRVKTNYVKIIGNVFADVKLTDWLSYRFNAGLETSFDFTKNVRKDGIWQYKAAPYPSSVNEERAQFLSTLFENTLNFNKSFGKHTLNGVVGISRQHTSREYTAAGRDSLSVYDGNYYTTIGSATGQDVSDGGVSMDYKTFGYLGRVNYSYNEKYYLTLTGRVDQDSRFGSNYRTGFFPSIAGSWRISGEEFFKVPWISELKINGSYGRLGIVTMGSWDYTSYINSNPRAIFGSDQNVYVGAYQARLANPDLHWEERTQQNIGIDAGFLENSVLLEFNVYNSLADDVILNLDVPGYLGNLQGNPPINAASIRNTGIEVALTYRSIKNDFKWDVSANFTTIKNNVEGVGSQAEGIDYVQSGNTRSKVGRPVGQWFVIKTDGLFQSQEEIDTYVNEDGIKIQPNAKPGDVKYIDRDGSGTINNEDRQFVKSPWPKLQTGLQVNASYHQFSLNIQFVGVFGHYLYNDVKRNLDSYQNVNFRSDVSPWTEDNKNTSDPRIGLATDPGISDNNLTQTDRWLENASYVKLRNVELGYNFSSSLLERAKITSARIYISGQNLFTITGYSGLDPDVTGANIQERGLDSGHWPSPRVFSAGVQFEF